MRGFYSDLCGAFSWKITDLGNLKSVCWLYNFLTLVETTRLLTSQISDMQALCTSHPPKIYNILHNTDDGRHNRNAFANFLIWSRNPNYIVCRMSDALQISL